MGLNGWGGGGGGVVSLDAGGDSGSAVLTARRNDDDARSGERASDDARRLLPVPGDAAGGGEGRTCNVRGGVVVEGTTLELTERPTIRDRGELDGPRPIGEATRGIDPLSEL
jgi:hypothetical protein